MPLDDQVIPIDFGGGLDTKTDPKKVVAGKYLLIENGVFTSISRVQKRNGYTKIPTTILGGGNLVAPRMVREYKNELVCQDQTQFYGYSPTLQCWIPKGNYQSIDLSQKFLYKQTNAQGYADCAVLGNLALYVWDTLNTLTGVFPSTLVSLI